METRLYLLTPYLLHIIPSQYIIDLHGLGYISIITLTEKGNKSRPGGVSLKKNAISL